MSTTKSFKFAAPYRSSTFNSAQDKLVGANGVLAGGEVTASGGVVSIQPLTFIQNGLVVTTDYTISDNMPSLPVPFSIGLSVTNSVENTSETLTPVFVSRPLDLSSNTVLVADWDGQRWSNRPKLQIKELLKASQDKLVGQDLIGINSGFDVTPSGVTSSYSTPAGNIDVSSFALSEGSLIDRTGAIVKKSATSISTYPRPVSSTNTDTAYDRIDTVLYRRPMDDESRSGVISRVIGDAFKISGGSATAYSVNAGTAGLVNNVIKVIKGGLDSSYLLYTTDYGDRTQLRFARINNSGTLWDYSAISGVNTLATGVSSADFTYDSENARFEIVYTKGTSLYYKQVGAQGEIYTDETLLFSDTKTLLNPKIASIGTGTSRFIHIIYQRAVSFTNYELYYMRRSLAGTTQVEPTPLVQLSSKIANPSVAQDDSDYLLFLAYENESTGRLYLRTYDVGSVTAGGMPVQVGTTLELQDDTWGSVSTMSATDAKKPTVIRTDTKDTYVFWLQKDSNSRYQLAVYHDSYNKSFGYKALSWSVVGAAPSLAPTGILQYAVDVTGMNAAHVVASVTTSSGSVYGLFRFTLNLETSSLSSGLRSDNFTVESGSSPVDSLAGGFTASGMIQSASANNNPVAYADISSNTSTLLFTGPGTYSGAPIAANEIVLSKVTGNPLSPGYNDLSKIPTLGDRIVITGCTNAGNNSTYNWSSSREIVSGATTYTVVGISTTAGANVTLVSELDPPTGKVKFQYRAGSQAQLRMLTAGLSSNMRGFSVTRSDIFLFNYRASDFKFALSGTSLEESTPVNRLYEFMNCFFGGGGTISWQVAGADKLQFTSDIEIRFFNRTSTYVIPADPTGTTIADGQVAYVELPDTDEYTELDLSVQDFGEGILDRYGKVTYPLFWNIGGLLYSRFAPYRIASGEDIILGDQLSQQMLTWLGASTSTPNPSNHGYANTNKIVQSDSVVSAISKLDAASQSSDDEFNKYVGQCRLKSMASTRVQITGADLTVLDGSKITRPLSSLKLAFTGAQIDFSTGRVYASDGTTSLGIDFTPTTVPNNFYFWYSVSLVPYTVDSNTNEIGAQILVLPASTTGTTTNTGNATDAPRAVYPSGAVSLGMVRVKGGATQINTIAQSDIEIVVVGGGSGTGSATGISSGIAPASGFKTIAYDTFDDSSISSDSTVDATRTNATYSFTKQFYTLLCDKAKTVSSNSGTSLVISGAVSWLKAGDVVYVTSGARLGQWRRIAAVSGTTLTLESAFTGGNASSGNTLMLSQAVWTKDLVNMGSSSEKTRLSDLYPGTEIPAVSLYYEDSVSTDDAVADLAFPARIVAAASPSGAYTDTSTKPAATEYSSIFRRPQSPSQILDYIQDSSAATKQRLFLVFFCDPTNASVTARANLLYYEASLYADDTYYSGGIISTAYGTTNSGSGSSQNALSVGTTADTYSGSYNVTTALGSATVTLSASSTDLYSWASVPSSFSISGTGIPFGTTVLAFVGSNQLLLSANSTASGTVAATFTKTVTEVTLGFQYVPGLNSGKADGDLEVFVEGMTIPRYYPGVVGTYYKEVSSSTSKIWISSDFTSQPYSIQVRRRTGTIDSYDTNRAKISLMADAVVGTADQVIAGVATHSSIQSAHDAVTSGAKIFVLAGTYTGDVNWTKNDVTLEGKGRLTLISGNLSVTGSGNQLLGVKVSGNMNLTGSDYNFVRAWISSTSTFTAGGSNNLLNVIQE